MMMINPDEPIQRFHFVIFFHSEERDFLFLCETNVIACTLIVPLFYRGVHVELCIMDYIPLATARCSGTGVSGLHSSQLKLKKNRQINYQL